MGKKHHIQLFCFGVLGLAALFLSGCTRSAKEASVPFPSHTSTSSVPGLGSAIDSSQYVSPTKKTFASTTLTTLSSTDSSDFLAVPNLSPDDGLSRLQARGQYVVDLTNYLLTLLNLTTANRTRLEAHLAQVTASLSSTIVLPVNSDLAKTGNDTNFFQTKNFCSGTQSRVVFEQIDGYSPTGVRYNLMRVWYYYEEVPASSPCTVRIVKTVQETGNMVYDYCASKGWASTNNKKILVRFYDAFGAVTEKKESEWKVHGGANCDQDAGFSTSLITQNYHGPDDELYDKKNNPTYDWSYGHCSVSGSGLRAEWSGNASQVAENDMVKWNGDAGYCQNAICTRQYRCIGETCQYCPVGNLGNCSQSLDGGEYGDGYGGYGDNSGSTSVDQTETHSSTKPALSPSPAVPFWDWSSFLFRPTGQRVDASGYLDGITQCSNAFLPQSGCTLTCDSVLPLTKDPKKVAKCGTVSFKKCVKTCAGVITDLLAVAAEDCLKPNEPCPANPRISKLDPLCL